MLRRRRRTLVRSAGSAPAADDGDDGSEEEMLAATQPEFEMETEGEGETGAEAEGEFRRPFVRGGFRAPFRAAHLGVRRGFRPGVFRPLGIRPGFRRVIRPAFGGFRRPLGFRRIGPRLFGTRRFFPGRIAGRVFPRRPFGFARGFRRPFALHRPWAFRRPGLGFIPGAPVADAPVMPAGGGSQWITMAQRCLAKILGPSVPQSGVMDSGTRNAIQAFQGKNQLPVTGMLDDATLKALQDACLSPGGAPAGGDEPPAGGEPPAPADSGAAEPPAEPPPADGAPADAAPAGGGEPPAAGGEGELFFGRHEGAAEQEFQVDGTIQVDLQWHPPVPLDKDDQFSSLPNTPGIYVIYVGGSPWYVGIAETSLRERFLHRRKALKDLQIPPTALAGRSVGWYALRSASVPKGAIQRRAQNNAAARFAPLFGKYSILRILEQYFIKQFKTATPKGNGLVEPVKFTAKGSLQILDKGARKASLAPNSQI